MDLKRRSFAELKFYLQIYPRNPGLYAQLLKEWIFWAVAKDIFCDDLKNLPEAQSYIWKFTDEKRAANNVSGGER
jgi:hypothetical protein